MEDYNCRVCGEGGCIFTTNPPKWAAESVWARGQCAMERNMSEVNEQNKVGGCQDFYPDEEMHDDRIELTTEQYAVEAQKRLDDLNKKTKEKDEDGLDQHAPGAKMDQGKVDVYRHFMAMFPDAMACVARVSEYGERKYTYKGWAKVNDGIRRYTAAMNRHILDEARGDKYDIDPEKGSDLAHAAQVAWNAMARLQLMIQEGEVEIRRGRDV